MKRYLCTTTCYSKRLYEAGKVYLMGDEVNKHKNYFELVPGQGKAPVKKTSAKGKGLTVEALGQPAPEQSFDAVTAIATAAKLSPKE